MNILICRHDKIGDFVLCLPLIKKAKEELKEAKIFVLVSAVNYEFAKKIPFIDEVLLYEDDLFALTKKIKNANIDVSVSAFSDTKLSLALLFGGINIRIAPATKFAQIFANLRVSQRRSRVEKREWEYNIDLLKVLVPSVSYEFEKPLLNFSDSKKILKQNGFDPACRYVAFHVGYGGSSDGNLRIEDYVKLGKIAKDRGFEVVFTFGPNDGEALQRVKELVDYEAIFFNSKLSLIDFCRLLVNFELFVSTSTGPMHLAAAVNIKTLSFFGDSLFASDKRWGSINENQNNFMINQHYTQADFDQISLKLCEVLGE